MHGGEIERELLIARIQLKGCCEFRFCQCGPFFRHCQDAGKLVIFDIRATGCVHRIQRFASEIQLTELELRQGERDLVDGVTRSEGDDLFAPGKRLPPACEFRGFRHDSTGADVVWIELEEFARDERCALVVLANKKFLRLLGEVVPPPDPVDSISSQAKSSNEDKDGDPTRPSSAKIPAL